MAGTKITDVIVPEIFTPYVIERTRQKSAFFQSGIIADVGAELGGNLTSGGTTVNMPFWKDLSGDDEVLSDTVSLIVNKITTGKDVAVLHFRGKAWGSSELASQMAGSDPMMAIGDLVADYWRRQQQAALISTLTGAFAAASMAGNVHDITAETGDAAVIGMETFIDASQKLGDARDSIGAVVMHSMTESVLLKKDKIITVRDSEGNFVMNTFLGRRVIVDDSLPMDAGKFTTYLFGFGAIGYTEGGVLTATETDRDTLLGEDILVNRKAYVMHPRGVKWIGTAVGASPTNTELATGTNWEKVFDNKNIPIVQFKHKVA